MLHSRGYNSQHPFSEEELVEFRQNWLKQFVPEGMSMEAMPQVDLVRFPDSPVEYGQAFSTCMTELGYPASYDSIGGISFEAYPQSQETSFNLAKFTCESKYTTNPVFATDCSPEQIGLVYDYWDEYLIPCLEAHGASVSRTSQPSRDTYIQNFHAADGAGRTWYPAGLAIDGWSDPESAISLACPPMPPSDSFYGVVSG